MNYHRINCSTQLLNQAKFEAGNIPSFIAERWNNVHEGATEGGMVSELCSKIWLNDNGIPFDDVRKINRYIDFILGSGITLDVKNVDRHAQPRPDYMCNVNVKRSVYQNPDFYMFTSTYSAAGNPDKSIGRFMRTYIVGFMEAERFKDEATIVVAGEVHDQSEMVCNEDMYNIPIESTITPAEFAETYHGTLRSKG